MNLARLIFLEFIPRSADVGLLLLRVWLGLTMLFNHGLGKLKRFNEIAPHFPDPLSFGSQTSLAIAIFAEVVCSVLLIVGVVTRAALIPLMVTMLVAFIAVHRMQLAAQPSPPGSGELAFVYLAAFAALFIAGPGRFSLEERRPLPASTV